ncbi:uncharacterized protein LOC111340009 [Stylophora pistillata]|uniref:uncharacterized protein LOC111340009 n=1 Tax=Stylophora pistillata TaxID=50429 RepID=UPI000C04C174|nr:uncharacterized protein LOC111340009 [Stylophora pistillata]
MEQDGTWGDHLILWAAANCYRIAIHVISSLANNSEIIINPDSPLDKNKHLILGHVHEVHYVSLQPLQGLSEIRTTTYIPYGRFKRPVSVSADQPHKQLRKELSLHDHCKGFNSYGLPAPLTVDYRNPPATFVNPNYQESQSFPQGFIRHEQLPSLVNQSQSSPQVPTWTHPVPSYHSNHTQDSFGFGLPASSIRPDPVNKRVSSGFTWPSSSVSNRHVPSQVATPLPKEPSYETLGYTSK